MTAALAPAANLWQRLRTWPDWVLVVLIYCAARLFSAVVFVVTAQFQAASPWGPERPDYLVFTNFWDAGWNKIIFDQGYPAELPVSQSGGVAQNQWAFYPVFPFIARVVSWLTGLDWFTVAPTLALIFGALFMIVAYKLFLRFSSRSTALTAVTFVAVWPTAPVFQTGYSESLMMFLLAWALLLVVQRRYYFAIPVVAVLDLSRPIGVAFSFFMLIHLIQRFVRRKKEPYPMHEVVTSWLLGVLSCAFAISWVLISWARTGRFDAYTKTEAAWSGQHLTFGAQWFEYGTMYFNGVFGVVFVLVVLGGFLWLITSPGGRKMGLDLQAWCYGYAIYLILFWVPQSSTFRILMPFFVLSLTIAHPKSRAYRAGIIACFLLLQIVWVVWLWKFEPPTDLPP